MRRLITCAVLICVAPVASATSCNDTNSYNVPNSIVTADIKDDSGRIERYWMVHRDEYCRAVKIEVLDATGEMLAHMIYRYDDSGENARTKLAETTVDTYSPDGSLLFRELANGERLDAAGNVIDDCAFLRYIAHAESSIRKTYEERCHDTAESR